VDRRRLDSRLANVGAEFLVLGHLLIEGIEAHKAYTNDPAYDARTCVALVACVAVSGSAAIT
jgi:hypothetical protein